MSNQQLTLEGSKSSFEELKKINQHGVEYWSARELQELLGYSQWRRFENTIKRAKESFKQPGNDPKNHFVGINKMVKDYHLSRFACYLIIQNGDPRKPEIAHAQKYFALQARRQELSNKMASGIFHDAGCKGLYGGLGVGAIKARKGIHAKEQLTDRMDRTELAANQFLMSQAREKLKRENIHSPKEAIQTYEAVGKEVRAAIAKIGGTPPENIPAAEPIKNVEKRLKKAKPRLELKVSLPE